MDDKIQHDEKPVKSKKPAKEATTKKAQKAQKADKPEKAAKKAAAPKAEKSAKLEKPKRFTKTVLAAKAEKLAKKASELPVRKKFRTSKQAAKTNAVKSNRLELLFTIVNRSKAEYYADLLHSFDVNMQVIALGHGTADASMMAYFGLDDNDKAVILSVINESKINDTLAAIEDKFTKIKNGKGIAYTVPLDGVIGTLIYGFLSNNRKAVKDNNTDKENNKA